MVEPISVITIVIAIIAFLVAVIAVILVFVRHGSDGPQGPQGLKGIQGATGPPGALGGEITLAVMTKVGIINFSGNTLTNITPGPADIAGSLIATQIIVGSTFRITVGGVYLPKQVDQLRLFLTNGTDNTQRLSSTDLIELPGINSGVIFKFEVILVVKQLTDNNNAIISSLTTFNNSTLFYENTILFDSTIGINFNLFGIFNTTTTVLNYNIFILERLY